MFVKFFVDRPIFATVLALIIVLAGAVCIPILPTAQFPPIAPPTVQISANYIGANANVVEDTVTTPIEQQVNGVQGMTYMTSYSNNDGTSIINATFDVGYNLNVAAMDVQNYSSFAAPQLPEDVRRYGVTSKKQATDFVMVVHIFSPTNEYDEIFLSNYAAINIVDVIKRIYGIGNVTIFGERKYSIRLWLDPDKLTSMALTASDVISSIREQNVQVAAGSIGQPPIPEDQVFQYNITTLGRLSTPMEFEDIIIRTDDNGAVVRVKDVAKVELGAENYNWYSNLNGGKAAAIGVFQLPGANSIDIANKVRADMVELSKRFPKGMEYTIVYDTTMFVRESIKEVLKTLFIAVFLVFAVIYIFLQNWRSTVIPAITIPVSLIGTFAVLLLFGFSINTLTLFGLVLAIGLVVDDAIVVVENVSRILAEENLPLKEATLKAMKEVTGPIIATTLVLMAVFVPVSFMPGISGQLYKQFALTIAISVGISAINALTLSPAMCALMLRKETTTVHGKFFGAFNKGFGWFAKTYDKLVKLFIERWKAVVVVFLGMLAVMYFLFFKVPTSFVPEEDAGYFYLLLSGPEGSSLTRTRKTTDEIEKLVRDIPGVSNTFTIGGYNLMTATMDPSYSTIFIILDPWDERRSESLSLRRIMLKVYKASNTYPELSGFPFNAPPIRGLSTAGGFQFMLEDLQRGSIERLNELSQAIIAEAKNYKELEPLNTSFKISYPQLYVDLDRTKAKTLGIAISDIFNVLQSQLGSVYVNDFNKYGRVYRVMIQADPSARNQITDISKLYVRAKDNNMVPLSSLVQIKEIRSPQLLQHYNLYRAVEINGSAAHGYSSGQAYSAMDKIAEKILPEGYWYEWTGVAYQEIKSGKLAPLIFALALAFTFLFLAAQYESWSIPLIIMFSVPLAILGALTAQYLRGLNDDVYCQIGLVMLIGLACKNAILIVEFAKVNRENGMTIVESALHAAHVRLRPILMTACAFIMGVFPLVIASGAGASSRHSLGTAVFGGMIASTFLSIGIVPVIYVIVQNIRENGIGIKFKDIRSAFKRLR